MQRLRTKPRSWRYPSGPVLKVNALTFFSNLTQAKNNLMEWAGLRDNYGVKVIDKDAEDAI